MLEAQAQQDPMVTALGTDPEAATETAEVVEEEEEMEEVEEEQNLYYPEQFDFDREQHEKVDDDAS